ncbi:MAG: hypothetical protein V4439_02070 [Patescibacteria group bacterium]
MYKKYLPSKNFIISLTIILVILTIIFSIYKIFFGGSKTTVVNQQNQNSQSQLEVGQITTEDLLQKDSDEDGIPDWEEALWGTDPHKKVTFDNVPDSEYVKEKKAELKIKSGTNTNNTIDKSGESSNETEKFSHEFFATYVALQQSGQNDPDTMKSMTSALGERVGDPTLPDKYSQVDIQIGKSGSSEETAYYKTIQSIFSKYKNTKMGEEPAIISEISSEDGAPKQQEDEAIAQLNTTANAYQDFSKKLINTPTPNELVEYALKIANSSYNLGIAVRNMTKVSDDPLVGLSGLAQYQKYSDTFLSATDELKIHLGIRTETP